MTLVMNGAKRVKIMTNLEDRSEKRVTIMTNMEDRSGKS